jgi:hypothetical protein
MSGFWKFLVGGIVGGVVGFLVSPRRTPREPAALLRPGEGAGVESAERPRLVSAPLLEEEPFGQPASEPMQEVAREPWDAPAEALVEALEMREEEAGSPEVEEVLEEAILRADESTMAPPATEPPATWFLSGGSLPPATEIAESPGNDNSLGGRGEGIMLHEEREPEPVGVEFAEPGTGEGELELEEIEVEEEYVVPLWAEEPHVAEPEGAEAAEPGEPLLESGHTPQPDAATAETRIEETKQRLRAAHQAMLAAQRRAVETEDTQTVPPVVTGAVSQPEELQPAAEGAGLRRPAGEGEPEATHISAEARETFVTEMQASHDDLRARIEETRRRIKQELEQSFEMEPSDEGEADGDERASAISEPAVPERVEPESTAPSGRLVAESGEQELAQDGPSVTVPQETSLESASDFVAGEIEKLGADVGAGPEFDFEAMRRKIESTRNRLKSKAFDAMMAGETVLLERSDDGQAISAPAPPQVDKEVEETVESTLVEEEY